MLGMLRSSGRCAGYGWFRCFLLVSRWRWRNPVPLSYFIFFPIGSLDLALIERSSSLPLFPCQLWVLVREMQKRLNRRGRRLALFAVMALCLVADPACRRLRSPWRMPLASSLLHLRLEARSWAGLVCLCFCTRLRREDGEERLACVGRGWEAGLRRGRLRVGRRTRPRFISRIWGNGREESLPP